MGPASAVKTISIRLRPDCKSGIWRFELDSHPGDAVLIAPVSRQIPWYQGILQGILRFWGSEAGLYCKKALFCSDFWDNSLLELTGKIF